MEVPAQKRVNEQVHHVACSTQAVVMVCGMEEGVKLEICRELSCSVTFRKITNALC